MMVNPNMPEYPDSELLRMASRGDADSFGIFYDRYSTSIFNYLLRLTHEQGAAEELLQDVFLAVWQGAKRFRGDSSVKTWMFRIAHHRAVSWLRKNRGNRQPINFETEIPDSFAGGEVSPEMFSFQSWQVDQIIQALDQLTETHRAVIELTYIHEFSQKEIAQIMRCPTGTVKSRMSYALRHLNRILRQMGMDGK
jgi:RNA polymerase sigma-70 factor (ECF subfamily)